jgi:transposase
MLAYSLDLRERVVSADETGEATITEIARRFSVGETFVKKMLWQKRETDSLERLPHRAGAKKRLSKADRRWLAEQIKETPDLTLQELREKLSAERNKKASLATICRELKDLRLPQKKNHSKQASVTIASERGSGEN